MLKNTSPDAAPRSEWRRLLRLLVPRWRPLALAALLLTCSTLLGLALPWAIRWLVDTIFVTRDLAQLNTIVLGLLVLFVVQSLLSVGHRYLLSRVGQRLIADLRLQIYTHVQRLPLRFFAERRTGEIVSRVTNDVTVVQDALTETPIALLHQFVTLVGGLTLMLLMSWRLTLLIFVLVPPIVVLGSLFGRRLQGLSTVVQDRLADATVALEEMLSGIRVVKSFARESYERERYEREVESSFAAAMRRVRVRAAFGPSMSLVGFSAMTLLLWYGGRQVVQGAITPGELIAFLFYMMLVAGPMGDFANMYGRLREALGAARRLFEIMDAAPEPIDDPGAEILGQFSGSVRFAGVSFAYDGARMILDEISLDVRPGEVVALVGPSGAGKTTLVNLIPRFYDPSTGRIELDGRDLRSFQLRALREQIGVVPQETFLFGGTIRENIVYGRPGAGDAEIEAAARAANAHEFIAALPDGYATIVGEKGVKLSAGQRQRVTIARVLLKDPRILILDEATSALDTESERLVQEALERLMAGRTTFVIAHRLSTIQRADRIVVLQAGRILEQGRHAELLSRSGLYQRLWSLQFADLDEPGLLEAADGRDMQPIGGL
jgi:subfamily B ATP-binding cassette protein MsbA